MPDAVDTCWLRLILKNQQRCNQAKNDARKRREEEEKKSNKENFVEKKGNE